MDGDEPKGRVIPFPRRSADSRRADPKAFEAWLTAHPAYRMAQEALAAEAGEPLDPPGAHAYGTSSADVWRVLDATVMSVAPEYFDAYRDETTFRRRFGFDLGRRERAGALLFKHETGLTDREVRLLGRTGNLRFGEAVSITASKGQAALGYVLIAAAGLMMMLGLLAAMTPGGQSLRGALVVVPYEAAFVAFIWAFMQMYIRPYTLRRRVDALLANRDGCLPATSVQIA